MKTSNIIFCFCLFVVFLHEFVTINSYASTCVGLLLLYSLYSLYCVSEPAAINMQYTLIGKVHKFIRDPHAAVQFSQLCNLLYCYPKHLISDRCKRAFSYQKGTYKVRIFNIPKNLNKVLLKYMKSLVQPQSSTLISQKTLIYNGQLTE